jgi:hypothetical protein
VGAEIITNSGRARVLAQEILAGQVLIETEDMRRIVIDAADVLTVLKREARRRADATEAATEELADATATEVLPDELAKLEDTVLPEDQHRPDGPRRESVGWNGFEDESEPA